MQNNRIEIENNLKLIKKILSNAEHFSHAARVIEFDQMTVCPKEGQEAAGESMILMNNYVYGLKRSKAFLRAVETLYLSRNSLDAWDRALIDKLHREILHTRNISEEKNKHFDQVKNQSWMAWSAAKEADDFRLFAESLSAVRNVEVERVMKWEPVDPAEAALSAYGRMLSEHEHGITTAHLDSLFASCKTRILALLQKIQQSHKSVRTDFLSRPVNDAQQAQCAEYLLSLLDFDKRRGTFAISAHPFTSMLSKDDIRVTTHYYPDYFLSSMYSIIHECGHALFEQLQPEENHTYFICYEKTMGMHESVSRFYENIIGRSRPFIHLIYPTLCRIFPQVLFDVTEEEFYEAVNFVQPSLIRMDADELTYTLHIIIRYEIEKQLVDGTITAGEVPALWNQKYQEYLGIVPAHDRDGVLQDMHWSTEYGYFPTYALGNFYGAMFYGSMRREFDVDAAVAAGDFPRINGWMRDHVFAKADRLSPGEWILDITGKSLTAEDFLTYLETKFSALYHLEGTHSEQDQHFNDYARRIIRIRMLSVPQLDCLDTAEAYIAALTENFRNIGVLGEENRKVVNDVINPILHSVGPLSEAAVRQIRTLNDNLVDSNTHDNTDLPIMAMLSDRLVDDALEKADDEYIIHELSDVINSSLALVVQTRRIISAPEISDAIRRKGRAALEKLMTYLDKEKFASLNAECKRIILYQSRFAHGLFVTMTPLSEEDRRYRFDLLYRSLALAEDPFYREAAPDYDWRYHTYRIYQYFSSYDEFDNAAANDAEQMQIIYDFGAKMNEMWFAERDYFETVDSFMYMYSHSLRNLFHAGKITRKEYRNALYVLYQKRDPNKYDLDAIICNIELPSEITSALDPDVLTEQQKLRIKRMYLSTISYIFHMPKLGIFYELMDYFAPLIYHFVEIPGGISFEEMVLQSFAALHPPTYIHSRMVADISNCLAAHLIREHPELFVGICGCTSEEEVLLSANALQNFAWHAAVCHDFGKLIIIDTIFVYGRKILDFEFDIIRQHPVLGADLLEKYQSTRPYADVARGHHLWYNGEKGYPDSFDVRNSPIKTIIDIVACADCMDAATDSIGRSYNKGKTLEEYIAEVQEGAGTRYAPYLAELLTLPRVISDLEYLLSTGRRDVYRSAYLLLKGVQDNGL